ncbi:MAG: hypothetical protein GPJ10_11525 [Microcystis aeruginosa L211-07]|nr:hypothetical protein [Microcystis aeruginosa L211-07]
MTTRHNQLSVISYQLSVSWCDKFNLIRERSIFVSFPSFLSHRENQLSP